jgi:hypothetical protein
MEEPIIEEDSESTVILEEGENSNNKRKRNEMEETLYKKSVLIMLAVERIQVSIKESAFEVFELEKISFLLQLMTTLTEMSTEMKWGVSVRRREHDIHWFTHRFIPRDVKESLKRAFL